MIKNIFPFIIFFVFCFLAGCGDDSEEDVYEVYFGQLTTKRIILFETRTDSVIFTIDGGYYDLEHITNNTNLCSSKGSVSEFGTSEMRLTPTVIYFSNCDSMRVPHDVFKTVYKGDSLILTRDADSLTLDITYEFRLKK